MKKFLSIILITFFIQNLALADCTLEEPFIIEHLEQHKGSTVNIVKITPTAAVIMPHNVLKIIFNSDFNSKTGRELLAFYLQTKFKQIIAYDKKCEYPIFKFVNPDFISRFTKRLINNPTRRFLIGITGESASGKSTICREIKNIIEQLSMPVSVLSTDNYFNDISNLIKTYGSFDNSTISLF